MNKELGSLKRKAAQGIFILGAKRVILQVIFSLTNVFLARLLFPEDFGAFAIVTFTTAFLMVFCDLGMGAALVQKKQTLSKEDLETAFTIQTFLCLFIALVSFLSAPILAEFFNLGSTGENLFRIYSLFYFFGPIKSTSSSSLERNLEYKKLVTAEVVESLVTGVVTIVCAFQSLGVYSFVIGSLLGHLSSTILYFLFKPWRIRLNLHKKSYVLLSRFGISYQANSILSVFYGPILLLYMGKIVGSAGVGYFQFAAGLSTLPLAIAEIIQRIVYPLGSRAQKNAGLFRKIVEHSIFFISATTLPMMFISISCAYSLIHFVYTDRWLPALPALYIGFFQMGIMAFVGLFSQFLLSLGKVKFIRNLALFWAVLTWVSTPILISHFNFVGMSISNLLIAISGTVILWRLKKEVEFSFNSNFLPFFVAAAISGLISYFVLYFLPKIFTSFVISVVVSLTIYMLLILLMVRKLLFERVRFMFSILSGSSDLK